MVRVIVFNLMLAVPVIAQTCAVIQVDGTDGAIAAPINHEVLYETADVRVIDVNNAPHTVENMHTHARPSLFYIDRMATISVMTPQDLHPQPIAASPDFKPTLIHYGPQGMHAVEDLGDTPFHALRVELKHPGCSLSNVHPSIQSGAATDDLKAAPKFYTLLYEDDDVRVLDVHIPPHTGQAMHTHAYPVFLYLTQPPPVRYSTQANPVVRKLPPEMKILPLAPEGVNTLENTGDTELHALRFELKHGSLEPTP
jgi:hypothetical protein